MACERLGLIVVRIPAAFPLQKQLGGSRDGAARACGYARIVRTGAIRKAVIDKKRQASPVRRGRGSVEDRRVRGG
jgi:hypothetical protein